MKYLLLLPRQPTGAQSCNTLQKSALKPSPPWWYHCTNRRAGGHAGEGHLGGQQLHDSERWLWEKWNTWNPKPAEQDFEAVLYLRQVPRSMGFKLGLLLSPQTLLLELPFPIRSILPLCLHSPTELPGAGQPAWSLSLQDTTNLLLSQTWHSQGSIFWSNCSSPLILSWAEGKTSDACGPGLREHGTACSYKLSWGVTLNLSQISQSRWHQSRSTSTGEKEMQKWLQLA